jgi:uncharacterized protein (TIGR02452 family)
MLYNTSEHDPSTWIKIFQEASLKKEGFRELRAEIFQQTVKAVMAARYSHENKTIELDNSDTRENTYFFTRPDSLTAAVSGFSTKFSVVEADCVEIAEILTKAEFKVCLLNMANRQNPGGGVLGGAGAQEENIFRRSNLFASLYQYANYSSQYGVKRNEKNSYPMNRASGGIYSKDVTIFRSSEKNGYAFLNRPFKVSIVSVPAINRPPLERIGKEYYIAQELIEPSKEKIRTILRISAAFNHDCLILSAFGCGAFCNPPKHMAALFKEVFNELEFKDRFKLVVFAILDDHNAWKEHNPEGNTLPFFKEFESTYDLPT